jgi:glutamate dehydrogenase/leucine dehydrogenase
MILPILGGKRDILAPDINTNEQTMTWIIIPSSEFEG